jgi:hypothetical protein
MTDRTFDAAPVETAVASDVQSFVETHRIDISFHKYGQSGSCYRVMHTGQTLIDSTREPLFDACRMLVAMDLKGRLEIWGSEPYPRMIVRDIEQAARLTVVENVNGGPRFGRYRPHPGIIDGGDVDDAD